MARIVVIGNCQAEVIAEGMRFFKPDAFSKHILSWEIPRWYDNVDSFINDLKSFDHIFSHNVDLSPYLPGGLQELKERFTNAIEIPTVVFPAYHPDLVYVYRGQGSGEAVFSPIGAYNSAIALFGYKKDLSAYQTIRLFNEAVYRKLGYFDMWEASQNALLASGRDAGLSLASLFPKWTRSGCFMHSINHSKIEPLIDISKLLLGKVLGNVADADWRPFIVDPLQKDAVWPIYPEIAEKFGLPGSYMFRRPDYANTSEQRYLPLETFVIQSLKSYSFHPKHALYSDRVENWIQNRELSAWLLDQV